MASPQLVRSSVVGFALAAGLYGGNALAHISLEAGGTHLSRYGDDEIKDAPCGRDGGGRGTNVYTYEPGETITIEIVETIPHPSYFRIAFDDDGDDDFVDPVSIKPLNPARPCPYDQYDQCGRTDDFQDFYNTPAVLPGMDNLNPHTSARFNTRYSWQVTLPDVECNNCTLQVIQVMEDVIHGGYNTDKALEGRGYIEDNYHQCIDLVLRREGSSGTGGTSGSGGVGSGGAAAADAGTAPGSGGVVAGSGGSSPGATGGTTAAAGGAGASASASGGAATGAGGAGGAAAMEVGGGLDTTPPAGASNGDGGGCSLSLGERRVSVGAALLACGMALGMRRRRRCN